MPQVIFCSPFLRAWQSAQEAAQAWGLSPVIANELDGRLSTAQLLDFACDLFAQYHTIMLVGHNPNITRVATMLNGEMMPFAPADCAVFDLTDLHKPKKLFQELS